MSEIDWSKAPEWATHYLPGNGYNPCHSLWLEMDGDLVKSACPIGEREKEFTYFPFNQPSTNVTGRIARPWNGEGPPPVGAVCELSIDPEKDDDYPINKWLRGDRLEVIAHRVVYGKELPVVWNERHQSASSVLFECFRPIRTPEQIAAEEREKAVQEMLAAAGVTGSAFADDPEAAVWAAALYDAGYRKVDNP